MRLHHKLKYVIYFVILLSLLSFMLSLTYAQQSFNHLTVQVSSGQVIISTIESTGDVLPLTSANNIINNAIAEISPLAFVSPSDIFVSPDGSKVALIIYQPIELERTQVIIYKFNEGSVESFLVQGYGDIQWATTSDALLLSPPTRGGLEDALLLRDLFIYDLRTKKLSQITNTPDQRDEKNVIWIENLQTVVFTDELHICNSGVCNGVLENLIVLNIETGYTQQLTEIQSILPTMDIPFGSCSIRDTKWSANNERLFFVISCEDGDRELLASTSLNGDTYLELNLPERFQSSETELFSRLEIHSLYFDAENRPLVVTSVQHSSLIENEVVKSLIIYKISDSIATEIFSTIIDTDSTVTTTDYLSTGELLAVGTLGATIPGTLQVIDVGTSSNLHFHETDGRVCNIVWLDNNSIAFDQISDGFCRGSANAIGIWQINNDSINIPQSTGNLQIISVDTITITQDNLELNSLCSPNPTTIRMWRVRNTNPVDIDFTWEVIETD